ncbi:MAG: hypothetical protein L6Q95_13405, partial [Planctomycetes bacterium]|nr:hypothetical protein [Planctomycetota bacterium]
APSDPDPGHAAPSGPTTPGVPVGPAAGPTKRATTTALGPAHSTDLRDRKDSTVVEEIGTVRAIEDKSFVRDAEGRWVDTAWDGKSERELVEAWSDEYFALLAKSDHRTARYLSVGERVIVVLNGIAYEIVPPA